MSSSSERVVADRYVLRRELGRGGMGVVWEAFDPSLDRVVAVKQVILPDHLTDSERTEALARVRREARSAARVRHPSVITVHDVLDFEGSPWVVMELVEGGSLQDRLEAHGAVDPDTAAKIAESLLGAVRAANAAGVLHRDIKPGNIMMSVDDRVILTDCGIATIEGGPSITRTGAIVGSPQYMSPERLRGGPAEHRSDLWSIGVTLFTAVEGISPFRRDSLTAAIAAVLSAPLPPMTRAGWLEPVITGLLERDPDHRTGVEEALAQLRERGSGGGRGPALPRSPHRSPNGGRPTPDSAPPPAGPRPDPPYGAGPVGAPVVSPDRSPHSPRPDAPVVDRTLVHVDDGRRTRSANRVVLGLGAGAVVLLLVALVGFVLWDRGSASSTPEGEPPPYGELTTFRSQWFDVGYPAGWHVDENSDDVRAVFRAPDGNHQVWVTGWTEENFTGTSAEYLEQTDGGTDSEAGTRNYVPLALEEMGGADRPRAWDASWDVAVVEADLYHGGWPDPERRFWACAISLDRDGGRIFYLLSANVPRDQADRYDRLLTDVTATFVPHV